MVYIDGHGYGAEKVGNALMDMGQGIGIEVDSRARLWGLSEPVVLGLIGVTFVLLFLGIAFVNSNRMEAALLQVQENKAASIVEGVERMSKELFSSLGKADELYDTLNSASGLGEAAPSVHETLATSLIEAARALDSSEEQGALPPEEFSGAARAMGLRAIVFVDSAGNITGASGSVPLEALQEALEAIKGGVWVSMKLTPSKSGPTDFSHVAIRRATKEGFILLILGDEELFVWKLRAAVQEAVETTGWRKGVLYLRIIDSEGGVLAEAGEAPSKPLAPGAERGAQHGSGVKAVRQETGAASQVLEIALPFRMDEKIVGSAYIGLDPSEMDGLLKRNRIQIYLSTGMMTMLALVAVGLLYRAQIRHRSRIQEIREKLHQAERLSSLGRLAAAVAHEVRNPLNAISMAVQRVGREFAPAQDDARKEFSRLVGVIRGEILRINRIVEEFLGLTRKGVLEVEEVRASELLDRLRVLIHPEASSRGIRVVLSGQDEDVRVMIDPDRMMQALLNLTMNALEAMGEKGGILRLGYKAEKNLRVILEIQDTGKGISPEEISKIFEPGYSTKGGGLGLGLHIAREIVLLHRGEIRVESEEGKGTTFLISLPKAGSI